MGERYLNGLKKIKTKFIQGFILLGYGFPYFSYDIRNYMRTLKDFGYFVKKKELEKIKFESLDVYVPKDHKEKMFYIIFVRVPEILKEKYRDIRTYIGIEEEEANKLKISRTLEDLLDPSLLESSPNKKIKENLEKLFKKMRIIIPTENKKEEKIFWDKIYSLSSYLNIDKNLINKIKKDILRMMKDEKEEIEYRDNFKAIRSIYV